VLLQLDVVLVVAIKDIHLVGINRQ
jgi:hypothetical protein